MNIHVYQTRDSVPKFPRWKARGDLGPLRIYTVCYATPDAAASKAIAMLQAAASHGEIGVFRMREDGSHVRIGGVACQEAGLNDNAASRHDRSDDQSLARDSEQIHNGETHG